MAMNPSILAWTSYPCDVKTVTGITNPESVDPDMVSRLVVYPAKGGKMLGIVEDVSFELDKDTYGEVRAAERMKIGNLLYKHPGESSLQVRCAPDLSQPITSAKEEDLREFLPTKGLPEHAVLGHLRMTGYPLPLDLDKLCFANTMILAGIGHGKSHVATMLAVQMHIAGKKVAVIDPTGEWVNAIAEVEDTLLNCPRPRRISVSHIDVGTSHLKTLPGEVSDSLKKGSLTIIDLSSQSGQAGNQRKCQVAESLEEDLFDRARSLYQKEHKTYGYQTCVFVEEAHQFIPDEGAGFQQGCLGAFLTGTKEGRKYGLGHVFIDQGLKGLSPKMEVQTYIMGKFTNPGNREIANSMFGERIYDAVQRTSPGANSTWVIYGLASPLLEVPWEIESFSHEDFARALREDGQKQ